MKKLIVLLLFTLSSSAIFALLFTLISTSTVQKPSSHFRSLTPTIVSLKVLSAHTDDTHSIEKIVQDALSGTKGTYAVVIKNLKTGEHYSFHEDLSFETASLYKLWVMGKTYEQIEKGALSMTTQLTQDVAVLNEKFRIASEAAEKKEGKIELPVKDALEQMITYSDNYSALLLAERLRLSNIATFLKENGFTQSRVGAGGQDPMTSAADIALFFERLYNHQLVSKTASEQMLTLLKRQELNGKIPKYLPDSTIIAHKTGELEPFSHDAGIVYGPKGEYILVVLSETNSRQGADERIAQISKAVYDYFKSNL